MNIELVDTHAHLDFSQFDHDREDVIYRAREVNVSKIITIGVDLATSKNAIALAAKYEGVYATIGIHPHDSKQAPPEGLREFENLAHHTKVVAIGEIGLDYYRDHSPREVQQQVFRDFLNLAQNLELPVIIHTRDAWYDIIRIITETRQSNMRGVVHCFSGDTAQAAELIEMGFYISFTGVVTFKNSRAVDVLSSIPLERLLLETDCPYMAPEPHRGKRNEPSYVRYVAQKVSQVKNLSFEQVAYVTTTNAKTLFSLEK